MIKGYCHFIGTAVYYIKRTREVTMMDSILNTASYIVHKYKELTGDDIDEMKLHKLLYFTQRDSLAMQGVPAFSCWQIPDTANDPAKSEDHHTSTWHTFHHRLPAGKVPPDAPHTS